MRNKTSVETVSGKVVDLMNPEPDMIDIDDIAWSLSRLARYNGHTIQKIPYTVGQHSIFVYNMVRQRFPQNPMIQLLALLHDAGEAYTGDISGPLKHIPELRPIIKGIEHKIEDVIFEKFGIVEDAWPNKNDIEYAHTMVKKYDIYCQAVESYNFMHSRGSDWNFPIDDNEAPDLVDYQNFEMPKRNIEVYEEFLKIYNNLIKDIEDGR